MAKPASEEFQRRMALLVTSIQEDALRDAHIAYDVLVAARDKLAETKRLIPGYPQLIAANERTLLDAEEAYEEIISQNRALLRVVNGGKAEAQALPSLLRTPGSPPKGLGVH